MPRGRKPKNPTTEKVTKVKVSYSPFELINNKASSKDVIKALEKKNADLAVKLKATMQDLTLTNQENKKLTHELEERNVAFLRVQGTLDHTKSELRKLEYELHIAKEDAKVKDAKVETEKQEANRNASFVVHKNMVLVEKLTDGFVVKQFKGERLSRKVVAQGYADLEKDVAGKYTINTTDVVDTISNPIVALLNECGSGAKFKLKVVVES